jgi:hypothetical protein
MSLPKQSLGYPEAEQPKPNNGGQSNREWQEAE